MLPSGGETPYPVGGSGSPQKRGKSRRTARLSERIREAVENIQLVLNGDRMKVTASIGATMWDGSEGVASVYKRADQNLYVAKSSGRNRDHIGSDMPPSPKPKLEKSRKASA